MDCEKFDRVVLDLLYEELDELTTAAARRHMEHCARCRGIASGLRATRQIGCLPLIEAPDGLEARILDAERKARARLPFRQRLGRGVSVMAGYAMRPQLAMAALLLLMIGSSLLFLRVKPGARESLHVTERGVPESEQEAVAVVPVPERARAGEARSESMSPTLGLDREGKKEKAAGPMPAEESDLEFAPAPPAAAPGADKLAEPSSGAFAGDGGSGDELYDQAMSDYRAGRYGDAQKSFDDVANQGRGNSASAKLFAAQSMRNESGCGAAAARFEAINAAHRGSGIGNEAAWQAADCYRALGQTENARKNYKLLVGTPGYGERAERALAALDEERVASRKPKAAAPAKAKPPSGGTNNQNQKNQQNQKAQNKSF